MIRQLAPELMMCEPGQLKAQKLPALQSVIVMDDEEEPGVYSFTRLLSMGNKTHLQQLSTIEGTR